MTMKKDDIYANVTSFLLEMESQIVFQDQVKKDISPPGGLEPPTFRLTAERASRLRHGGFLGSETTLD